MNKMEILRLAFEKTAKPEDAMRLAREMVDFVSEHRLNDVPELAPKLVSYPRNSKKYWSDKDIEAVIDMTIEKRPLSEIAAALKRTEASCKAAIRRINLGIPMGKLK
jgi:hypothetical protein